MVGKNKPYQQSERVRGLSPARRSHKVMIAAPESDIGISKQTS
jgi:hypothetical protein